MSDIIGSVCHSNSQKQRKLLINVTDCIISHSNHSADEFAQKLLEKERHREIEGERHGKQPRICHKFTIVINSYNNNNISPTFTLFLCFLILQFNQNLTIINYKVYNNFRSHFTFKITQEKY